MGIVLNIGSGSGGEEDIRMVLEGQAMLVKLPSVGVEVAKLFSLIYNLYLESPHQDPEAPTI